PPPLVLRNSPALANVCVPAPFDVNVVSPVVHTPSASLVTPTVVAPWNRNAVFDACTTVPWLRSEVALSTRVLPLPAMVSVSPCSTSRPPANDTVPASQDIGAPSRSVPDPVNAFVSCEGMVNVTVPVIVVVPGT